MIDNNNDLIKEWYRFSMVDLATARHLYDTMHPKPLEIIVYHCQQSAEKMLKGFLVANSIEPPKIHDLIKLRIMCSEINANFEELKKICRFLNPFGSQPRYPNEIEVLETDVETALNHVQSMVDFFESQGIEVKPK